MGIDKATVRSYLVSGIGDFAAEKCWRFGLAGCDSQRVYAGEQSLGDLSQKHTQSVTKIYIC